MSLDIPYLGLTGVAGAGKDTVFDRLAALGGSRFVRLSVADPLKESVAHLFGVSLKHLDHLKRDPQASVHVRASLDEQGQQAPLGGELFRVVDFSMRQFLQRYGTESHRNVFGEDFWLDVWERRAQRIHERKKPCVVVNTSVRFVNEAERIIDLGGEVWHVEGPQDAGAGGHESEAPLPDNLIAHRIDNATRIVRQGDSGSNYNDFSYLDDQIATLLHGGSNQ